MKLQTVALALALVLLALFTLLNWTVFMTPTPLSLGVVDVSAPLGVVMLGITATVIVLFLAYIVTQQAGMLLETRRTAKELKGQREVADQAEASRFAEMRAYLEAEMRRVEAQSSAGTREVGARIDQLEQAVQATLEDSGRTLLAYLAEIEDKLDRALPPARST